MEQYDWQMGLFLVSQDMASISRSAYIKTGSRFYYKIWQNDHTAVRYLIFSFYFAMYLVQRSQISSFYQNKIFSDGP